MKADGFITKAEVVKRITERLCKDHKHDWKEVYGRVWDRIDDHTRRSKRLKIASTEHGELNFNDVAICARKWFPGQFDDWQVTHHMEIGFSVEAIASQFRWQLPKTRKQCYDLIQGLIESNFQLTSRIHSLEKENLRRTEISLIRRASAQKPRRG